MKHTQRLFLLFLTLALLPLRTIPVQDASETAILKETIKALSQQNATLQENLANLCKQIALSTNPTDCNKIPFYRIRSLGDAGIWTWQNKYNIAQMTLLIIALCALKRKIKPERSTVTLERASQLEAEGHQVILSPANETSEEESKIALLADKIGDFGLYTFEKTFEATKYITCSSLKLTSHYLG